MTPRHSTASWCKKSPLKRESSVVCFGWGKNILGMFFRNLRREGGNRMRVGDETLKCSFPKINSQSTLKLMIGRSFISFWEKLLFSVVFSD